MTADAKDQNEPTMEEILASIRRIISEDGQPTPDQGQSKPASANEDTAGEDVLELTEVVEEPERPREPPKPATAQADIDALMAAPPEAAVAAGSAEGEAPPPERRDDQAAVGDGLLSATTSAAATSAFAGLAQAAGERAWRGGDIRLGDGDKTLEDIVRELLRPMLREWLDANLPPLVERLVRREIERVARRAEGL